MLLDERPARTSREDGPFEVSGGDGADDEKETTMNITATALLAIADADDLRSAANCAWHLGNNAGDGYDPEGDDLGEIVLAADADDHVAIYRDGDDVILVGDSNGPWAVRVRG